MYQLENLLKNQCDPRLSGVMSMAVRHASNSFDSLVASTPILQREEFRNTYGYLRHSFVDFSLKWAVNEHLIDGEIIPGTSSKYPNGHTYYSLKVKGAVINPVKTRGPKAIPKNALYRQELGLMNQQISLFDNTDDLMNKQINASAPAFLLLTYGGKNYSLDYIELGLPDVDTGKWIGQANILNAPLILPKHKTKEVTDKLDLTLTSISKKILEEENDGDYTV